MLDRALDHALDLLLGGSCVGCGAPGRSLCVHCRSGLPLEPWPAWPDPVPAGLVAPWTTAAYDGVVRAALLAHKERHVAGLAAPLATLLAASVAAAVGEVADGSPVLLVPVPSRPGVARRRGHEPLLDVVRRAARLVPDARVAPLLRSRGGVRDQAGLTAVERAVNLAGSLTCPAPGVRRLGRSVGGDPVRVVVCDDVLTTGATVREAQRALTVAGLPPVGVATVAATRRRTSTQGELSGPRLSSRDAVD